MSTSRMYSFVRSRQLEGTMLEGPEVGTWPITSFRVMRGWGAVEESDWPYVTGHWPPQEPVGLDAKAKKQRIRCYQRIRTLGECRIAVARGWPVVATFLITKQWFSAANGVIEEPTSSVPLLRVSHAVVIMGYADQRRMLTFGNSWGVRWGDGGVGYLSYAYFGRYCQEAWVMYPEGKYGYDDYDAYDDYGYVKLVNRPGVVVVAWELEGVLGDLLWGLEVYDVSQDEMMGWAFALHRDGFVDVEELFVRPRFRGLGYGSQLMHMLRVLSANVGLPIRLWFPHADGVKGNMENVARVIKCLSLNRVSASGVRWAWIKAVP